MASSSQAWAETAVGALVVGAAATFLIYAATMAQSGGGSGYELSARFGQVGSLASGSDVRLAGVKIGQVTRIDLDPKTFLAKTRFSIDSNVKLPSDSTVKITSDSLLGGQHVSIEPGGALDDLKPGAEFQNVQGSVDLFGLIGSVLRPQGAAAAPAGGAAAPATPAGQSPPPAGAYGPAR